MNGAAAPSGHLRGRQRDQAVGLHAQHRHPACHVFEAAVRSHPVQLLAHQPRQRRTLELRRLLDHPGNGAQFLVGALAPAIAFHRKRLMASVS
jgi:hypothetical protein